MAEPRLGSPPAAHRGADDPPGSVAPEQVAADAFAELFLTRFTPMVRLAALLGSSDPEDLVQQAFANVLARWPRVRLGPDPAGYLCATVVNLGRSQHRRSAVQRRHRHLLQHPLSIPDPTSGTAEQARIVAALHRLGPRHREALVLRFWLDYSEKQMAEAMNTSVGSVKSHVSRGLAALRVILEAGG